jgi:hypothetical protein
MVEEDDELEDLDGINGREFIREEFVEYRHFENARRKENNYWTQ